MGASDNKVKRKGKAPPHAWKKGQSGNPGGRPKMRAEFVEACRTHSKEALEVLVREFRECGDHRIKAAVHVLEYAWGKAAAAPEDRDAAVIGAGLQALATEEIVKAVRTLNETQDEE